MGGCGCEELLPGPGGFGQGGIGGGGGNGEDGSGSEHAGAYSASAWVGGGQLWRELPRGRVGAGSCHLLWGSGCVRDPRWATELYE